jgi:hypothetical protein
MYRRPGRFKYNHRSLNVKPDSFDLSQMSDMDMKKVEALKRAVSDGTYAVAAEDLAPKLMESMFQSTIFDDAPNGRSGSQGGAGDQVNPQHRSATEVSGGMIVNRKDSRSA